MTVPMNKCSIIGFFGDSKIFSSSFEMRFHSKGFCEFISNVNTNGWVDYHTRKVIDTPTYVYVVKVSTGDTHNCVLRDDVSIHNI